MGAWELGDGPRDWRDELQEAGGESQELEMSPWRRGVYPRWLGVHPRGWGVYPGGLGVD